MPTRSRPARPRLRVPVLVRGADQLQIGLDPPAAVLLEVPGAHHVARLLRHADGTRTLAELESVAADTLQGAAPPAGWLPDLLVRLRGHGLVVEGPGPGRDRWADARLRLVGAGPVAGRIAALVAAAGVGTLVVYDEGPADGSAGSAVTRAQALRHRLAQHHPLTTVSVVNHWSKPDSGTDLTVVLTETLECDRGLTDAMVRGDQPHLIVRPAVHGAIVGPAVRPGRTPCLRCLDLARRDLDPGWPDLLRQLVHQPGETDATAAEWAAVTACTQVLALLGGHDPETLGATLELRDDDHLIRTRRWRAHPMCGCHWGQAAEWGP